MKLTREEKNALLNATLELLKNNEIYKEVYYSQNKAGASMKEVA